MIQYLGCHSIRLPLNTAKIYVVVMRNVLPGKKCDERAAARSPVACACLVALGGARPRRRRRRRPSRARRLRGRYDGTFDLKGATANRQRVRGAAQQALVSGERAPGTFKTLLDKDWMARAPPSTQAAHALLPPPPRPARGSSAVPRRRSTTR